MIKNHFLVSIRFLKKYREFTIINISGLAIGMIASLLIFKYVTFELSFDTFFNNYENTYRVQHDRYVDGTLEYQSAQSFIPLGEKLTFEYPEILDYATLFNLSSQVEVIISHETPQDKAVSFIEKDVYHVKGNVFKVFDLHMLEGGSNATSLNKKEVIISSSTAKKLFGSETAINKEINSTFYGNYNVVGVFEDLPKNSHISFNYLFGWEQLTDEQRGGDANNWQWDGFYNYIIVSNGSDTNLLQKKFAGFIDKYIGDERIRPKFSLQPIAGIHLNSDLKWEPKENGSAKTIYSLIGLACFILLVAWVNYINLSTSKTFSRALEVSVKKSMGATKMTIFSQFLIESFIVNFSALIIAVVTVQLLSSLDINISGIMVSLPSNSILFVYVIYFTIVIFGTLIVGLYPAAIASSFKPSLSTKINEMALPLGLPNLRKVLVVSQFTLSMVLLIVAFSIFKQVSFMQKKDLGIDLDQTLVINTTASFGRSGADSTINRQFDVLRNQLSNYANVKGVALSYDIPGKKYKTLITSFRNGQNKEESLSMYFSRIDHSFIEIMDVKLLAGRNFSELENSNGGNVIINVEAVNDFRFDSPEDALGKKISYGNNYDVEGYEIIGVVDFRVTSFTEKNPPIVFQTFWGPKKYLSLKLDYENIEQLTGYIQQIKNEWTAIFPNKPFDYFYLKDSFETQYKDNVQFSEVLNKLTFLSILVACLGLYGLSIFLVQKKTKEIGIRKVFGSSSLALITLLLKDIMVLVFIAGFIAIPMGWILVNKWMQQYPYVNDLPWWTFVVPIVGIILITFLIIGNNVIRASYANPVASLRNE